MTRDETISFQNVNFFRNRKIFRKMFISYFFVCQFWLHVNNVSTKIISPSRSREIKFSGMRATHSVLSLVRNKFAFHLDTHARHAITQAGSIEWSFVNSFQRLSCTCVVRICVAGSSLKVHKRQGTFSGRRKQHSLEMTVVTFRDDILNYEFRRCVPKLGQSML